MTDEYEFAETYCEEGSGVPADAIKLGLNACTGNMSVDVGPKAKPGVVDAVNGELQAKMRELAMVTNEGEKRKEAIER